MASQKRKVPTGGRIVLVVLALAAAWFLAVLILPGEGMASAGRVTAFGLTVVVGIVILGIVLTQRDWDEIERKHIERRHRRRG